jgi:hypothetical protein
MNPYVLSAIAPRRPSATQADLIIQSYRSPENNRATACCAGADRAADRWRQRSIRPVRALTILEQIVGFDD